MQKSLKDYPKRGEIFIADLDPGFGREIHKRRPVLIISNNTLNKIFFTSIIIPFSSAVPKIIGEEMVEVDNKSLNKGSVILINQIRSVDQRRLIKKISKIPKQKMAEVEDAIKLVLDMAED